MSRDNDLRDCSRQFLEQQADLLRLRIIAGEDLQHLLDKVEAAIPHAADYHIDHRDRDCRRS